MKKTNIVQTTADADQPKRGRPPKPLDLYAAFERSLLGASIRQQARQLGCTPRTLMGRYAEKIEWAEARFSSFLKMRLFTLAVVDKQWPALHFLMREIIREEQREEQEENCGNVQGPKKWTRRQLQRAMRIAWRYSRRGAPRLRRTPAQAGQLRQAEPSQQATNRL